MIKLMIKCGLLPLNIALEVLMTILASWITLPQLTNLKAKKLSTFNGSWRHTWRFYSPIAENLIADENRRYQWHAEKSAVLNANRGGPRKSQSLHRAHLAIFADRLDRLAKSLSTSLVLHESGECCWSLKYSNVNRVSKMF